VKPYVTAEQVEKEIKFRSSEKKWEPTPANIAHLINYYAKGAVTCVSNHIYYAMEDKGAVALQYGIADHCRCLSCYAWQLVDENGKTIDECESLDEWVTKD
jgi:hypothetical protein